MNILGVILAFVMVINPVLETTSTFVKVEEKPQAVTVEVAVKEKEKEEKLKVTGFVYPNSDPRSFLAQFDIVTEGEDFGGIAGKIVVSDGNVYVSEKLVMSYMLFVDVRKDVTYENALKVLEEVSKNLDGDYILLCSYDEFLDDMQDNEEKESEEFITVMLEALKATAKEVKLDTGLVTKTSNTMTVKMTGNTLLKSLKTTVKYFNNNSNIIDTFTNIMNTEFEKLAVKLSNISLLEYNDDLVVPELNSMLKSQLSELDKCFDTFTSTTIEPLTKEATEGEIFAHGIQSILTELDKSELNFQLKKTGSNYSLTGYLKMLSESGVLPNTTTKFAVTTKSVSSYPEIKISTKTSLEDFTEAVETQYYVLNPVDKLEIIWDGYDVDKKNFATLNYNHLENEKYTVEETQIVQLFSAEGRTYLPMRLICERFGEKVEWDEVKCQAFVVRDTDKIPMTGIVKNGRTLIKVRDFEKLGYTVDYDNVNGKSIATVTKNK